MAQTSFCHVCELCSPSRCGLITVNQASLLSQTCELPHVCATRQSLNAEILRPPIRMADSGRRLLPSASVAQTPAVGVCGSSLDSRFRVRGEPLSLRFMVFRKKSRRPQPRRSALRSLRFPRESSVPRGVCLHARATGYMSYPIHIKKPRTYQTGPRYPATVAGSAPVGCGFRGTNALVNRSHGRLGKMWVVGSHL